MPDAISFLDTFKQWATSQPRLLAVALVGSYARGTASEDSDIDLVLITTDPQHYLQDDQWLAVFGPVRSVTLEDWGLVQSRRVFYADRLEVEFGITTPQWTATDPVDEGTQQVLLDGVRILYDPQGLLRAVLEAIQADD